VIDRAASADPLVRSLLAQHPKVRRVEEGTSTGIEFQQGSWLREVLAGNSLADLRGLVELMDNNPIVCADSLAVPSPAATLAMVALGPLASASLIADVPTIVTNVAADDEVAAYLATAGWDEGAILHHEPVDLGSVVAATIMVPIQTPEDLDEIDALYAERFGRSFFVQRDEESEWDPQLVRGTPRAVYRIRIAPENPISLLTIRVLADTNGKAGATQLVHAMNVMAGYEESLGVAG